MYGHDVISDAVAMYGAMAPGARRRKPVSERRRFAARRWGSCSTRSTGRSTRAGSGRPTARRSRSRARTRRRAVGDVYRRDRHDSDRPGPAARQRAAPAAPPDPRWLRLFRGRRGASVVYPVFAATYLGAAGRPLAAHSPYNHFVYLADGWLHGRFTWPARRRTRTTGRRSTCSSCVTDASSAAPTAAVPEGRSTASTAARRPETVPADDIVSRRRSVRLVPTVPRGGDGALRRRLGAVVQRRAVHRAVGRPEPDVALPAAAPPAGAGAVAAHGGRRPVADRAVRCRFGLLLLLGRRSGLVHRAGRRRHALDRIWWASLEARDPCWRGCSSRSGSRRGRPGWCPPVRLRVGAVDRRLAVLRTRKLARPRAADGEILAPIVWSGSSWPSTTPRDSRIRSSSAKVPRGPVAGADLPLWPVQLSLPVTQPRHRAGPVAAPHDPLAVPQDQPARDEHPRHVAEPRLRGDAAAPSPLSRASG